MLRRSDGLALAASCVEKLRSCGAVSLSTTPLAAAAIADPLSWIEIAVEDEKLAETHAFEWTNLREAVDVLHALSQCAGFAPHLNVVFWRDVLHAAGVGGALHDLSSTRFDPNFPRFRLLFSPFDADSSSPEQEASRVAGALRRFFAVDSTDSPRSAAFASIMAKVQPFQSPSRQHPMEIALSLPSMDTQCLLPAITALTVSVRDDATMELKEITLNQRRYRPKDPLEGAAWLTNLHGVSCFTDWTLDERIDDPRVFGELYRRVLGIEGTSVVPIRTLHVQRTGLSDAQFGGLCSALPFSRSVQVVRVFVDPDWPWDALSSYDWAWLGYALFHEKNSSSTWRGLVLEGCELDLDQVEIAEKSCQHGVHALSEYAYHRGRFYEVGKEKSVVQVAVCAKLHSQSVVAFKGENDAWGTEEFDCLEALSSDGSTAIIVPGYGLVLVESNDLVSSRQRPARSDCCRLDFLSASHKRGQSSSGRGLHLLLELCGATLRSLDILHHEALESLDVQSILQSCPQLEEIALNHDGKLWSSPLASQSIHLKAIRLSCSLIEAFCVVVALCDERKASFPNVQALYFHVTKGASVFHSMSKRLGDLLLANPTIEDFAMVNVRRSTTSSRITLDRLKKSLATMRISPEDVVSADLPSNTRLKNELIAVLKLVWSRKHLPVEIFETVISYVAVGYPRHVGIDLI